jgi:hypothetical protein
MFSARKHFPGKTLLYPQNGLVSTKKTPFLHSIITDFLENFIRSVKPAENHLHNTHEHVVIYDANSGEPSNLAFNFLKHNFN